MSEIRPDIDPTSPASNLSDATDNVYSPRERRWERSVVIMAVITVVAVAIAAISLSGGNKEDLKNSPLGKGYSETSLNAPTSDVLPTAKPRGDNYTAINNQVHATNEASPYAPVSSPIHAPVAITSEEMRAADQKTMTTAISAAIAFVRLQSSISFGTPFVNELAIMRRATSPLPTAMATQSATILSDMEQYSESGVMTTAQLNAELARLTPVAVAASNVSVDSTEQGWWAQIVNTVKSLITVRKIDEVSTGNTDYAQLEAISQALAKGHLSVAITQLESLSEPVRNVLKDWHGSAKARVAMDKAMAALADVMDAY